MKKLASYLVILAALNAPLAGEIVFEQQTVEIKAAATDLKVTATFPFTNQGDYPVTILETRSSCGCTTAKLEKMRFEPGESSRIEAIFDIGQRLGRQSKVVTIRTDDPAQEEYKLTLVVDIPDVMKISTRGLVWKQGDPADPKTIDFEVTYSEAIHLVRVLNQNSIFNTELITVEDGRHYRLVITPGSTAEPQNRMIQVVSDFPATIPKTYMINVRVQQVPQTHAATPPTPPS